MINQIQIRNLRGIRELDINGLGRLNLVIGKNGSGKTTVLAASALAFAPPYWIGLPRFLDDPRPGPLRFDSHMVSLCPGGDTDLFPEVLSRAGGVLSGSRLVLEAGPRKSIARVVTLPGETALTTGFFDRNGLVRCEPDFDDGMIWWAPAFVESEATVARALIDAYKKGKTDAVVAAVQLINPSIEAVELAGTQVFVRVSGHPLPLPFGVLGDGARRVLEFALAVASGVPIMIDEIENGFHYSTLPAVIGLLRGGTPNQQVFATTHREEVIRTACEVYLDAEDDGLRIIRIDRDGPAHRGVVYSAAEALAGLDSGLELRG